MSFRSLALLIAGVYLLSLFYYKRWDTNILYGGDTWGYYGYLPAAFIYGDLQNIDTSYKARFLYTGETPFFPSPGGELPVAENGHRLIKYTCGVALMQAPFFFVGHVVAAVLPGVPTDGYAWPYLFFIHLSNLVYFFVGIWLLYRVLVDETQHRTAAALSILLIALGTHLYNFEVYRGPMAHGYLFSLYCGLLFATVQFYRQPQRLWALGIGACAGLITLIRPVEIIALAIPLLYGLTSWQSVGVRLAFWRQQLGLMGQAVLVFILCGLPQLAYWKYASGHWHFDGYPGEAFDFAHSRIHGGLFSFQNGWLVYSPAMILSLLGIGYLLVRRNFLWPVLVFLPLQVYIAYSWWCWYYINGFGSRPMVEAAALLAIPLAYLLQSALRYRLSTALLGLLMLAFISLNLFQNWQHAEGILWTEAANKAYYKAVFGKTAMSYDALVAFDSDESQPDSSQFMSHTLLYRNDFEAADSSLSLVAEPVYAGKQALLLTPEKKYFEFVSETAEKLEAKAGQYLRVSAWCYKAVKEFPWYTAPSIVVTVEREGRFLTYRQVRIDSKLANVGHSLWGGQTGHWGWVRLFVRLPDDMQANDRIKAYVMAEKAEIWIDEVAAEIWQ